MNNESSPSHSSLFIDYPPSGQRWIPIWPGEIAVNIALFISIRNADDRDSKG